MVRHSAPAPSILGGRAGVTSIAQIFSVQLGPAGVICGVRRRILAVRGAPRTRGLKSPAWATFWSIRVCGPLLLLTRGTPVLAARREWQYFQPVFAFNGPSPPPRTKGLGKSRAPPRCLFSEKSWQLSERNPYCQFILLVRHQPPEARHRCDNRGSFGDPSAAYAQASRPTSVTCGFPSYSPAQHRPLRAHVSLRKLSGPGRLMPTHILIHTHTHTYIHTHTTAAHTIYSWRNG